MNKLKHTPGPWKYEKGSNDSLLGKHFVVCDKTECDITAICKTNYGEHDARLIAAAPEMLDCLIHCLETECTTCNVKNSSCVIGKVCNKIKYIVGVIEKATGKTIEDIING